MFAQQTNIDVISNNLANVNTASFKRSSVQFEDVMYSTEKPPGAPLADGSITASGIQIGYGVREVATTKSFDQGNLQNTGAETDVAIQGKGFFRIQMPDGSFGYTRDGGFHVNDQGQLVSSQGYRVDGTDTFDPQRSLITIGRDGSVSQIVNNDLQQLAPIQLVNIPNPQGLEQMGENLFRETAASGAPEIGLTPGQNSMGTISQGFVETSNVRVVEEMVRLIQAQRAYEVNSKSIQASDEMMGLANNIRR